MHLIIYLTYLKQKLNNCKYKERPYCYDCTECFPSLLELATKPMLEEMAKDYSIICPSRVDKLLSGYKVFFNYVIIVVCECKSDIQTGGQHMKINKSHIEKIIFLAKEYGATRLILFGSAGKMHGEARDLDLACDGIPGWKLYELAAKLEEELKTSLDIVPLSPSNRFTRYIESKGKILL